MVPTSASNRASADASVMLLRVAATSPLAGGVARDPGLRLLVRAGLWEARTELEVDDGIQVVFNSIVREARMLGASRSHFQLKGLAHAVVLMATGAVLLRGQQGSSIYYFTVQRPVQFSSPVHPTLDRVFREGTTSPLLEDLRVR